MRCSERRAVPRAAIAAGARAGPGGGAVGGEGRPGKAAVASARANPYQIDPASPWFHVVNVSGGRSSAFMLRRILDAHGGALPARTEAIFANTGREVPATLDFVQALSDRWDVPITWLEFDYCPDRKPKYRARVVDRASASVAGEPFTSLLDSGSWLPSVTARICTSELKVGTIDRHLWQAHGLTRRQARKLIGFRHDEPARWKPALYQRCEVAYPMVDAGVTARDVAEFWGRQPFDLGIASERGNCDLCYLKPRWNLLETIREQPSMADWWIEAERRAGRTFRIGESFEALKAAALAPGANGEVGPAGSGPARRATGEFDDRQYSLPCFCTD